MPQGQYKVRINSWKKKAVNRREENEKLKKRIKELVASRDVWKRKYSSSKKAATSENILGGEKASKHQYSLAVVVLFLSLYNYGSMSLRSCRYSFHCMVLFLGLETRIPSHSTIRNWLCKSGYYRLKKGQEIGGDYVIYVDESIVFGSEKILLILGTPLANLCKDKALSHRDMSVLFVGASKTWKGEDIGAIIKDIASYKTIKYAVSDQGSNLRKAYKLQGYTHIEDCTHILANYLKHIYEADETFSLFQKLIAKLRGSWTLSKDKSQYRPPCMRGKMRFANIFPCVNWAKKCLKNWDTLSEEVQKQLAFLKENKEFISSLITVEKVFKTVCKKLKNRGFGILQKQEILNDLAALNPGKRAAIFIQNCKEYLDNLSIKSKELQQEHLLCSSDIIESYFGKFKTKINPNNPSGLTEFIFTIANFTQSFSVEEAKNALENIKCKDLVLNKNYANLH